MRRKKPSPESLWVRMYHAVKQAKHGLDTRHMLMLAPASQQTLAKQFLRAMIDRQIVYYEPIRGVWKVFIPYEWFGEDIYTDPAFKKYTEGHYAILNQQYEEDLRYGKDESCKEA